MPAKVTHGHATVRTMREVWLVRHGESESNAGASSADPAAIPLTPCGHAQAARLAQALPRTPALIAVSPYLRAIQTAAPTRARFPTVPLVRWPVQEFTFLGDLHGRVTTPAERRPHVDAYWRRADPHESVGGAESFSALVVRARECLARVAAEPAGPVVVFTHETFIRAVVWSLDRPSATPDHRDMRAFRGSASRCPIPAS